MADSAGVILDKKIARRLCRAIITYSGNTSNMTYHLQRMHLNEYKNYLKRWKKKTVLIATQLKVQSPAENREKLAEAKQITLSAAFKRAAPLPPNSPRYFSLLRATMNFIFQTLQPLSIVDEPTFCNLLRIAEPKFQLPHQTYITSQVLPEAYSEVWTAVEKQLDGAEKGTVMTDL